MKTLVGTISTEIRIQPEHLRLIEAIDALDLGSIIKHAARDLTRCGLPIHLTDDEVAYALRQYYSLAALNPANAHAVSAVVDPYWHTHVLHTVDYAKFCQDGIGYFMHHSPLDEDDVVAVEEVGNMYGYTLDVLKVMYPHNVHPVAWGKEINVNRICFHFHRTDKVKGGYSLFEPDPRFVDTRRRLEATLT